MGRHPLCTALAAAWLGGTPKEGHLRVILTAPGLSCQSGAATLARVLGSAVPRRVQDIPVIGADQWGWLFFFFCVCAQFWFKSVLFQS